MGRLELPTEGIGVNRHTDTTVQHRSILIGSAHENLVAQIRDAAGEMLQLNLVG